MADQIIVMDDGQVQAVGTRAELVATQFLATVS
jgi:ABC-type multidrug transport system fused ATPase/permease subunit